MKERKTPLDWAARILGILALLAALLAAILYFGTAFLTRDSNDPAASPSPSAGQEITQDPEPSPEPSSAPSPSPSAPEVSPSPSPSDTPEPSASPNRSPLAEKPTIGPASSGTDASARAQEILDDMTLHEKLCQLFIVSPEAITGVSAVVAAGDTTRQALADWPVGGFLYSKANMQTREQVTTMLTKVQTMTEIPLILTCDEEGGRVNRLMSTVDTTWVGPMLDYKDEGTETALANARTIASDLKSCGFNTDLAPVADVWSNPANTVIGDRAYSDDFAQAAELVAAAVEGFHAGGVACTLKHFPGHGDTSADSHYGSVYVYKTLEELRENELLPFQAGIDAGADAVMIGHLILPELDSEPAPFSYAIVTKLLRQEMGFDGVIMTDGLQMQAMTDHYSSGEIATKSIQAGVDLLLCPEDLEEAVSALKAAVTAGNITEARIDESVLRILTLKLNQGMLS